VASFNLDLTEMMNYAAEMFNSLQGIVVIIGGLGFGVALVVGVLKLVQSLRF